MQVTFTLTGEQEKAVLAILLGPSTPAVPAISAFDIRKAIVDYAKGHSSKESVEVARAACGLSEEDFKLSAIPVEKYQDVLDALRG